MFLLEIITCTEAGKILNKSAEEVKQLIEQKILNNYGTGQDYMTSEEEIFKLLSFLQSLEKNKRTITHSDQSMLSNLEDNLPEPSSVEAKELKFFVGEMTCKLLDEIGYSEDVIQGNELFKMGYREGLHKALRMLDNEIK